MASSFARLQQDNQKFVAKLVEFSGLGRQLVENVVSYARCLIKPNSTDIDENIFTAEMLQQFGLTSKYMIALMFHGLKGERSNFMSLDIFCKCICTFLCDNLDTKINFVFSVYDLNMDGSISFVEMYTFLKPCVLHTDVDEMDTEDNLRELIEIVIGVTDRDENREIDIAEFRRLVKSNILYLQLLGPCLPRVDLVEKFKAKLVNKSTIDVRKEFENERRKLLFEIPPPLQSGYYPIKLEMP